MEDPQTVCNVIQYPHAIYNSIQDQCRSHILTSKII